MWYDFSQWNGHRPHVWGDPVCVCGRLLWAAAPPTTDVPVFTLSPITPHPVPTSSPTLRQAEDKHYM